MFSFIKNFVSQGNDHDKLSHIVNNGALLVDVRSKEEFASGSTRGAVNIPLDQVQSQLAKFQGREHIVVFCRSGNRSRQAQAILEQNGFANVINGGTWQKVHSLIRSTTMDEGHISNTH